MTSTNQTDRSRQVRHTAQPAQTVQTVLEALPAEGAWIVGGTIRDALSGIALDEYDIDVAAVDGESWARRAADVLGSNPVRLAAAFDIWRIPLSGGQIDVWNLPDGDIERDLRRRDFTVNAMAAPLDAFRSGDIESRLIDPAGGRADIEPRRLRLMSDEAFRSDPVRLLRAIRFEAEGGWRLAPRLQSAMTRDADRISESAPERIWMELSRILQSDRLPWSLRRLEHSRLLDVLFPELTAGRGVDQRPVHRRDVFRHQMDAAAWIVRLTDSAAPRSRRMSSLWRALRSIRSDAATEEALIAWKLPLRLATLLHDIGKPQTRTVSDDGATHFYGHAELGAELAEQRLSALRAPNNTTAQVSLLIRHHLRPGQINAPGQPPTRRALHRFHTALSEAASPLCFLFLADSLATVGVDPLLPRWSAYTEHVARILNWQPAWRSPSAAARILDGRGIMSAAEIPPGPLVGRIRAKIDEAAATGEITDIEEARAMARSLAAAAQE